MASNHALFAQDRGAEWARRGKGTGRPETIAPKGRSATTPNHPEHPE
jgi:hypothetical protein